MLYSEVPKENVLRFAETLTRMYSFSDEDHRNLIKKGLNLYRQGSVYNIKFSGETVQGRVQDVIPVDVSLNLELPEVSSCGCPSEDFCRHRMALFFAVYASVGRVGGLLDEWKEEKTSVGVASFTPTLRKAKDLQKPFVDDSLTSWLAFFSREYEYFTQQYSERDRNFISVLYYNFYHLLNQKAPKVSETKRLFAIHAGIFTLNKLLEVIHKQEIQDHQFDSYVTSNVHNLIDGIIDDVFHLRTVSLPFALDMLLFESMHAVREVLLRDDHFLFNRFSVYRALWSVLFNRKKWIEEEQDILIEQESNGNLLALAHLTFLQKKDVEAINYLSRLDSSFVTYSFWWIHVLSNNQDWKRVRFWVDYSTKLIDGYILNMPSYEACRHFTRVYLSEISDYCEEQDPELFVDMMKKLLPYSFVEFDYYLLRKRDYYQWVNLQLLAGYSIEDCDRQTLKQIEEQDRSALLPLYHQGVLKALEQKNRSSYKLAVRYLKKLRTSYKRLNQLDYWDMYIEKIAHSHKRLRAFQEELQRAKLVAQS